MNDHKRWRTTHRLAMLLCAVLFVLSPIGAHASDDLTWYGTLESRPNTGRVGPWAIGGKTFVGTENTEISEENGPLSVGACIRVVFVVTNDTKIATKIASRPAGDCSNTEPPPPPPVVTVYGMVNSFPQGLVGSWVISKVDYTADSATVFHPDHGPFNVGICVRVDFSLVDGGRLAKGMGTVELSECSDSSNEPTTLAAIGRLNSFPENRLGDWIINQILYQGDSATEFNDSNGSFEVGACVKVTFIPADGMRLAKEIETQSDSICNGSTLPTDSLLIYGKVSHIPDGQIGDWEINDHLYHTDSATVFNTAAGPLVEESCVRVVFANVNDGRYAKEIASQDAYRCEGDDNPRGEARGVLTSFPPNLVGSWVIGSTAYTATLDTRFHQEKGPFFTGNCIRVQFMAGTATALDIGTIDPDDCRDEGGAEQKAYGKIISIPAEGVGAWVIGAGTYTATLETELDYEHGPLEIGTCAEVKFSTASGENMATQIGSAEGYKCGGDGFLNRSYGMVQGMPVGQVGTWLINNISYEATTSTSFEDANLIAVGSCVTVAYYTKDGVRVAHRIVYRETTECNGPPQSSTEPRKIFAPIDALPDSPYVGAWTIGGINFTASPNTRFEQNGSPFAVGDCVAAKYVVGQDSTQLISVEKKRAERCTGLGDGVLRAFGPISSLPDGLIGTWVIGDLSYESTISTTLEQPFGLFAVGAFVEVQFQVKDGVRVATKIATHVAPGDGRDNTEGPLDVHPDDDTGTWVVDGVSYVGDPGIEVDLEGGAGGMGRSIGTRAVGQVVTVNSYTDTDGTRYALSITASQHSVYMPLVQQ